MPAGPEGTGEVKGVGNSLPPRAKEPAHRCDSNRHRPTNTREWPHHTSLPRRHTPLRGQTRLPPSSLPRRRIPPISPSRLLSISLTWRRTLPFRLLLTQTSHTRLRHSSNLWRQPHRLSPSRATTPRTACRHRNSTTPLTGYRAISDFTPARGTSPPGQHHRHLWHRQFHRRHLHKPATGRLHNLRRTAKPGTGKSHRHSFNHKSGKSNLRRKLKPAKGKSHRRLFNHKPAKDK